MLTDVEATAMRVITQRLNESASLAAALMNKIDSTDDELTGALQTEFSEALLKTREGITRARELDDALAADVTLLRMRIARMELAIASRERCQLLLRKYVKKTIETNPGVPFRDTDGTKIYVRNNNPSLKLAFEDRKKTVSHVAPENQKIPDRFLKTVTYTVIDTDLVREAIKSGENIDFAWLEQGSSLVGL